MLKSRLSRRRFLGGLSSTAAALAAAGASRSLLPTIHAAESEKLPSPASSGIEHVVLVMMENRSFDHFLGWMEQADGRQNGLTYVDKQGVRHHTFHLTNYQNCNYADPDHSYAGGRIQFDHGGCDGWLRAGTNDVFPIGYYTAPDLSFLSNAAPHWTVCDHYFAGTLGPTYPNRIYQHAAQTDRLDQSTSLSHLPTIWDSLKNAGLDGRYFYSDVPFTALWGTKYLGISQPFAEFQALCASGALPQVSFVDPRFLDEGSGTSGDDHPHADIRNGEAFLNEVYKAVTTSPAWPNTVLIINFDEWGGFFDHVPPPLAPIPTSDAALGSDGRLGFRVPAIVISPFAHRSYIDSMRFDHTSVLKLIEWRWGLRPLTVRDATANNLASVLNFSKPHLYAPQYNVPPGPFGGACLPSGVAPVSGLDDEDTEWTAIASLAQSYGFNLY